MLDNQNKTFENNKKSNNVKINLKDTLNILEEQWEQEKRHQIDKLLATELVNILVKIDFSLDLKSKLEMFCHTENKNLSYDFLKSI
jgi:hypothetical protein